LVEEEDTHDELVATLKISVTLESRTKQFTYFVSVELMLRRYRDLAMRLSQNILHRIKEAAVKKSLAEKMSL